MNDAVIKKLEKLTLKKGYSLDYLTCGSPIFQVADLYSFTSDSIELAHFVQEEKIECLVDLCSGSGVVGLEIVGTKKVKTAYLIELQKELAKASKLSSRFNLNKTNIHILNIKVQNTHLKIGENIADVIVSNPPYFKKGGGAVCKNYSRAMARHELELTLEELLKEVYTLLKVGGAFYLIHIKSRIDEIRRLANKYNLVIIEEKIIQGKLERVLVKMTKNQ